jgi:hypothetical protein
MAAQKRSIATLEPSPLVPAVMVHCKSFDPINMLRVLFNIRTLLVTRIAVEYVQLCCTWAYDGGVARGLWNQEQWRNWMAKQLGLITATGIEVVYEASVLEFEV